eukprot:Nitzschia sp. Nitz4//scaffold59_size112058//74931//75692//NITZ4_004117-RA/size112058-processed-gene-0.196-mRNA-1//1//CDS//3329555147//5232//frame0
MVSFDLQGKVVLVTGANRGIGKAFVERFLDEYGVAKVYAAVRTLSSADPLVAAYGPDKVVPLELDMSKPETIEAAAKHASDVEVVINNAGVLQMTDDPMSADAIDSLMFQFNVNVLGLIHVAQQFVPILERNGGGALVQLNSTASLRIPARKLWAYSTSKHASYGVTQGLRAALKNTYVLSVHPGPIATDMADQFNARDKSPPASQVPDAVAAAMKKGDFFVYPDAVSQGIGEQYASFASGIVLPRSEYQELA